jgi:hypothetical protein
LVARSVAARVAAPAVASSSAAPMHDAERPHQRAVQAVAEFDLVGIQLRPARAHAGGDVAARQERADLLRHGPEHGQRRERPADTPEDGHGETTDKPIAAPKVRRTNDSAAAVSAPARICAPFDEADAGDVCGTVTAVDVPGPTCAMIGDSPFS